MAWGSSSFGGDDSDVGVSSDILEISDTVKPFVALKSGGHLLAWGNASYGRSVREDYLLFHEGKAMVHKLFYLKSCINCLILIPAM